MERANSDFDGNMKKIWAFLVEGQRRCALILDV